MDPWAPENDASHFDRAAASAIEPGRKQDCPPRRGTGVKPGVSTPGMSGPTCTEVPKGRRHSAGLQAAAAAGVCLRPFGTLWGRWASIPGAEAPGFMPVPLRGGHAVAIAQGLGLKGWLLLLGRERVPPFRGGMGISGDRLPGAEASGYSDFALSGRTGDGRSKGRQGVRGFGLKVFP
jgi:hypothetical protein